MSFLSGIKFVDAQRVINESRPMLEEFLSQIGLHRAGRPIDFPNVLDEFSRWLDAQEITEDLRPYVASRLGAFICEYLIEVRSGKRVIENGRILMRVPTEEGVQREFDPYAVAICMAANRNGLKAFLDDLSS
ncbi:MAG: hypothetical protein K8T89_25555 [Planctomycetes bacterium]|nr:hypothetical protein [Planctomycetota bacterium]